MRTITVGSRRSALAMTQTNGIIARLKALDLPYEWAVKQVVTKGDRILNVTLSKVGGKGLFVKEIEKEMLEGTIDLAVHSMKDMPAEMAEGLVIGAVPERIDPRDVLVTKNGKPLEDLPKGAVIGTSSLRRGAQMKAFRPDFEIKWIRGNIETRLRKLPGRRLRCDHSRGRRIGPHGHAGSEHVSASRRALPSGCRTGRARRAVSGGR